MRFLLAVLVEMTGVDFLRNHQPWTGCNKKTAVSARLKAVGVPKKLFGKIQMLIFAPNLSTNLANHAGWAGQAGAVTRLPSTWAASMATSTY